MEIGQSGSKWADFNLSMETMSCLLPSLMTKVLSFCSSTLKGLLQGGVRAGHTVPWRTYTFSACCNAQGMCVGHVPYRVAGV